MPGFSEWLIIGGIALLIWGPSKLPQLGGAVGKALRNFRQSSSGKDEIDVTPKSEEQKHPSHG
ncbi:MAG TPA: twin-arginine translocase TatA/TatE family subunit [Bdellovibrionota bacterium]|nr:twin-arginine translocase TatA/TatE family subunit [Bdellovibrionota bacterium]